MFQNRLILACISLLLLSSNAQSETNPNGRTRSTLSETVPGPVTHRRIHYVGNAFMKIGNDAKLAGEGGVNSNEPEQGVIGHDAQFEFPANSRRDYLFNGSLWVGGIVGIDTLVSEAVGGASEGAFEYNAFSPMTESADFQTLRQTFTAEIYDTLVLPTTSDEAAQRRHMPLGLHITQRSHAIRLKPYDEFIIIEYTIRNISNFTISEAYVGVFVDADVWPHTGSVPGSEGPTDDVAGFLADGCIAYAMDNDGDPDTMTDSWTQGSMRGAMGIAPIRIVPEPTDTSFNWWATNFANIYWGPSIAALPQDPVGIPWGDVGRYAAMSNGESDYDQLNSALDMTSQGWRANSTPTALQANLANGLDTRILLSFGPFELIAGDSIVASFAVAGGEAVHTWPNAFAQLYTPSNPAGFLATLDFSSVVENVFRARTAYELGFRLPGAPPAALYAALKSDTAVRCDWTPAPFDGVSGYRLYRREDNGEWRVLFELGDSDTTYFDSGLNCGSTYEYAVSALDADGHESTMSHTAIVTPGRPPVVPTLTAKSVRGKVKVDCIASTLPRAFSQPEYLNIYRRREDSPIVERIRRYSFKNLRLVGGSLDKYTPSIADPARARDDEWSKGRFPYMEPPFFDNDVESGVRYYYSASVTNGLGLEGDTSLESSALALAMDRRGMVIYHTHANSDGLINKDSLREFYGTWCALRGFDSLSVNTALPPTVRDSAISMEQLSRYEVVILVMEDDAPVFPRPWSQNTGLLKWLTDYSKSGGRLVLTARNADSTSSAECERTLRELAGLARGYRERWVIPRDGGVANWESYIRFKGAYSLESKYPPLEGDSAKALNFSILANVIPNVGHRYIGGYIPAIGFVDGLLPGTEVLYRFRSDQPDTSIFEGQVVGVRRLTDSTGGVIMFAFPLSLIKYDQAWNALSIAVDDLGADTSWTIVSPDVNQRSAILDWLYGPASAPPDPAWDINRDGVIDIRDVVEVLDR